MPSVSPAMLSVEENAEKMSVHNGEHLTRALQAEHDSMVNATPYTIVQGVFS